MATASQPTWLEALRAQVRAIEGGGTDFGREVASLGGALDAALPWRGLPHCALHEVAGEAASSFVAALACRLIGRGGALVWCQTAQTERRLGTLYGPGLRRFGLDWRRVVLVRAPGERDVLWAMEEALRSPAVACAVAELGRIDLLTSRRLQLAAEAGKGAGIALRIGEIDPAPNAALTRWWAEPLPISHPLENRLGWRLTLWRCRGGAPGNFKVRWDEQTLAFDLAPRLVAGASAARSPAAECALSA
jgi:protein ImuA